MFKKPIFTLSCWNWGLFLLNWEITVVQFDYVVVDFGKQPPFVALYCLPRCRIYKSESYEQMIETLVNILGVCICSQVTTLLESKLILLPNGSEVIDEHK